MGVQPDAAQFKKTHGPMLVTLLQMRMKDNESFKKCLAQCSELYPGHSVMDLILTLPFDTQAELMCDIYSEKCQDTFPDFAQLVESVNKPNEETLSQQAKNKLVLVNQLQKQLGETELLVSE